jgi:hypothetical protein
MFALADRIHRKYREHESGAYCRSFAIIFRSTHGSKYDTAGLHRSRDPGSGAFCPYHSSETTALVDIPAGAELFASYGDYWIPNIPGVQITIDETLEEGETWLQSYYDWMIEHNRGFSESAKEDLWELISKDFPLFSKAFTVFPRGVLWKDIEHAFEEKAQAPAGNISVVKKFIRSQSIRTPEWLAENGHCQDHLRPGNSTIPQAGRGAFATRDLPKGTVVSYAPLIHIGIHGTEIFRIKYKKPEQRVMDDLIVNYSFGHRNSTLKLTPYGGMVNYINHQQGDKVNVKVRWPDKELVAHKPDWLTTKSPEDLKYIQEKIGISFEYVATRDIKKGEEVFMVRVWLNGASGSRLHYIAFHLHFLNLLTGLRTSMARSLGRARQTMGATSWLGILRTPPRVHRALHSNSRRRTVPRKFGRYVHSYLHRNGWSVLLDASSSDNPKTRILQCSKEERECTIYVHGRDESKGRKEDRRRGS